ncbi:unnamed protein product [Victoria cruziana]
MIGQVFAMLPHGKNHGTTVASRVLCGIGRGFQNRRTSRFLQRNSLNILAEFYHVFQLAVPLTPCLTDIN